jgi:hypothetical protein
MVGPLVSRNPIDAQIEGVLQRCGLLARMPGPNPPPGPPLLRTRMACDPQKQQTITYPAFMLPVPVDTRDAVRPEPTPESWASPRSQALEAADEQ